MESNLDLKTVQAFGEEWSRFDQSKLAEVELVKQFEKYFWVFPWDKLPAHPIGFDLGCGSGRWARLAAPRVEKLLCIDASEAALSIARKNLVQVNNIEFHNASVASLPMDDDSMDFGYSLGVLHHIPDTKEGIRACVAKLKPGAPLLLYLYYSFDNRPTWFRVLWKISDVQRKVISAMPFLIKRTIADLIALAVYFPLAICSLILEKAGLNVSNVPLSTYRNKSFYTMRTDALDRFGTRLEHRFSRTQITQMMKAAGLENIEFSSKEPYWCAIGFKRCP